MRKTLAGLVLLCAAAPARAQDAPDADRKARQQAELKEKYDAKVKEPWLKDGGWITDLDRAREKAAAERKIILAYFTVSYLTSEPCEKLEGRLLASEEFRKMAGAYVLYVNVASRLEGEKHTDLLKAVGGWQVPWFGALGPNGEVLAVMDTKSLNAETVGRMMGKGAEYFSLVSKKDLTPIERIRMIDLDFDAGRAEEPECRKRAAALQQGLDREGLAALDRVLVRLDVAVELAKYKKALSPDPKFKIAAGKVFTEMYRAGRIPVLKREADSFFSFILDYAEDQKDIPLFEMAMGRVAESVKNDRNGPIWIEATKERFARLKAAAGK
jgi:hypothetical protein